MVPELKKAIIRFVLNQNTDTVERALNEEQMGQGAQINYRGLQWCYCWSLFEGAMVTLPSDQAVA